MPLSILMAPSDGHPNKLRFLGTPIRELSPQVTEGGIRRYKSKSHPGIKIYSNTHPSLSKSLSEQGFPFKYFTYPTSISEDMLSG